MTELRSVKDLRGPCGVYVSVTGYPTPKVPSMTIYYCSASPVIELLALCCLLNSSCLSFALALQSFLWKCQGTVAAGSKNTRPLDNGLWRVSASYLILLSLLLWLIFASPISITLSYVMLIWLYQNLAGPMFHSQSYQIHWAINSYYLDLIWFLNIYTLHCRWVCFRRCP